MRSLDNLLANIGLYQIDRETRQEEMQGRGNAECQKKVRVGASKTPKELPPCHSAVRKGRLGAVLSSWARAT